MRIFDAAVLAFNHGTGADIVDFRQHVFVRMLDRIFAALGFRQNALRIIAGQSLLGVDPPPMQSARYGAGTGRLFAGGADVFLELSGIVGAAFAEFIEELLETRVGGNFRCLLKTLLAVNVDA